MKVNRDLSLQLAKVATCDENDGYCYDLEEDGKLDELLFKSKVGNIAIVSIFYSNPWMHYSSSYFMFN